MTDSIKSSVSGYGLVFKRVMKDTGISIEAKALYSYLSAYAGADESSFPSVSLIKYELNIGKQRYQRARKELEDTGYLVVTRKQNGNIYGSNLYTVMHEPRRVDSRPVDSQPVEIQSVDNQPTTINSSTINSNKNNNNTSDATAKIFEYISNNLEMIQSPLKIDEIEYEINMIKDDAYEITKIAVDYCKEKNKGIPYLISILKNWNKEGIDTVEKAKAKVEPKKT